MTEIKADPIAAARHFASEWKVNLVLQRGADAHRFGRTGNVYINSTGNAGMACGGMGDVLTGMIAAMTAHQGMSDLCSAACAGVYLHGAAGDACRKARGPMALRPWKQPMPFPASWLL